MSWKFERIYDSDGTELSNATVTTTIAGAVDMAEDGRYVWVTAGTNGVAIYEYWGAASDNEPDFNTLDELVYPRYDSGLTKKLRLVTFIKLTATTYGRVTCLPSQADTSPITYTQASGETAYAKSTARTGNTLNATYIAYLGGKMYVTNGASFSQIFEFDCVAQSFVREISVAETHLGRTMEFFTNGTSYGMNSNLCAGGERLWFVGTSFSDDAPQRLYALNPVTNVKTTTDIPVRPTRSRTWLAYGNNGSVYITNYNNVSVTRFNVETAAFGAKIRLNAFPTRIFTGPDRRIWVSSFAGALSLVDWDDDGVHQDWGTEADALAGAVDPTDSSKFWFVKNDGTIVRMDLNTNEQFETGSTADWGMGHAKLSGTPDSLMFTRQLTYTDAAGASHTVKPYMFIIQDGKVLALRMEKYLYRDVYGEMRGQAAVVAGPLEYFGEQG